MKGFPKPPLARQEVHDGPHVHPTGRLGKGHQEDQQAGGAEAVPLDKFLLERDQLPCLLLLNQLLLHYVLTELLK